MGDTSTAPMKVVLEPEVANELMALLIDEPGDANEELLDDALEALESNVRHIPSDAQKEVARGRLVAVQVDVEEIDVARTLIEQHEVGKPGVARRLGDRLRSRLQRAERRRVERRQRRGHLRLVS